MRIISIGPAHPFRGGLASFNDRLAQQFISEGHDIEIITFTVQYPKLLFPGKTQFTDAPPPEGVKISRKLNSVNPLNWIKTGLFIKKARPEILLIRFWLPFMGPCFGTVARIARKNSYTKPVCIFDNVIPHEKRAGDKLLTKYFVNSIAGGVVMSETVFNELKLFSTNLPVILSPHPLFDNYGKAVAKAEAKASLGLDSDCSYMLFFGFIRAYKGLDILIEAFSDKRLRNRKIRLLVAGEFYEDDSPYHEMIRKFRLEDEIIFFDHFVKDNEVPLFFSAADIVVQPYKSATQSGVTQIAYFYNKPMLVTDVGGLKEIVVDGKCGYVVKPEPAEIATALVDFYENSRLESFTEGLEHEKEKFSWAKMTQAIRDVYNKCV